MTFKNVVEHIRSLPPLSDVAISIHQLYQSSDDVDTNKLVKLIESDALLSVNILRMINTPYYSLTRKISSVRQAVALLGSRAMYSIVIHYAMRDTLKTQTGIYGLSNSSFNDMCNLQKTLITLWYSKINFSDAQFLAPLALMMETGKLILEREIVASDYKEVYLKGLYTCESIQSYEYELFDTTSYYISGLLFEHWNLEPRYVEILKIIDSPQSIEQENDDKIRIYVEVLNIVRTAINVNEMLTEESILKAAKLVDRAGLNRIHFLQAIEKLKESYLDDTQDNI